MLENAWYSVIAPESCSTILVKNTEKKDKFAEYLKLTATELKKIGIIDDIIKEPVGGAHNNPEMVADQLKIQIKKILDDLITISPEELVQARMKKFMKIGRWSE